MKVMTDKEKKCLAKCKCTGCKYMGICCNIKRLNELQDRDPLTLIDDEHKMKEELTEQFYELCMSLSPESCGLYQGYEKERGIRNENRTD